jgi:hypothetical protein
MEFKRRPTFNGENLALVSEIGAGGGGGETPSWHGVFHSNMAGCSPIEMLREWNMAAVAGPTPTNISVSIARIVKFKNPAQITVARLYLFGVGATTNLYKFAIYRVSDRVRIWESGPVSTAANTWLGITFNFPVTLAADTDYWFAVAVAGTGTVAGFRSSAAPLGTNFWGAASAPFGNVSHAFPVFAQFAVTGGAFPATMPVPVAAAYAGGTTGSVPFAILSST